MKKLFVSILLLCIFISTEVYAKENFFDEALKMYQDKKYDDARFMLERNIVFNPKDANLFVP